MLLGSRKLNLPASRSIYIYLPCSKSLTSILLTPSKAILMILEQAVATHLDDEKTVIIMGGTPADNSLNQQWRMHSSAATRCFADGFQVSLLSPTVAIETAFINSYQPVLSCHATEHNTAGSSHDEIRRLVSGGKEHDAGQLYRSWVTRTSGSDPFMKAMKEHELSDDEEIRDRHAAALKAQALNVLTKSAE